MLGKRQPDEKDVVTRNRLIVLCAGLVVALVCGLGVPRFWLQVSEGSAAAAVTQRIIATAVAYHCRTGRYPTSLDEMHLDLTGTDGGSTETLRWIEYRSTTDWFSVRNRLMDGGELQYPSDSTYCEQLRTRAAANQPRQPVPTDGAAQRPR
jgi:hypothetical protein